MENGFDYMRLEHCINVGGFFLKTRQQLHNVCDIVICISYLISGYI